MLQAVDGDGEDDDHALDEQLSEELYVEKDEAGGRNPALLARKLAGIVDSRNPGMRYIVASPDQKLAVVLKKLLPAKIFDQILASHYGITGTNK